jgi:SAM-dependent methyltransferase
MVANRRLTPSLFQADWYVLGRLRLAIEAALSAAGMRAESRALDMGCGDRPYEAIFRDRGLEYVGADLAVDAEVTIRSGETTSLPASSFDLGLSFQVLEHVWDIDWYLAEIHRMVKPGGSMILSTHGAWLYHPHPTDFRRWTKDGLVREIETRGWKVNRVFAIAGPLAWSLTIRAIAVADALTRFPLIGKVLANGLCFIYNVRIVIEDRLTPKQVRDDNACVYVCLCARLPEESASL